MDIPNARVIAAAVAGRHAELERRLRETSAETLVAPSLLPGWSRLTIACHLRFGAETSRSMTVASLAGLEAAFYPEGRATQRPYTLRPRAREAPIDVVASFTDASARLDSLWASLGNDQWAKRLREPPDNPDLGSTTLGMLALLRLTEVEVHGLDLDIGCSAWSDVFVDAALPVRIRWLGSRRSNHADPDESVSGRWVLRAVDGSAFSIEADANGVAISEGEEVDGDVELSGTKSDLLAFLLGRLDSSELSVSGDREFAASFRRAFPAP